MHHGKVDVSHVQAKFHSAMAVIAERTEVLFYKLKAKKKDTKQKYINKHTSKYALLGASGGSGVGERYPWS